MRDQLIAEGRARPHHVLPHSGWITVSIGSPEEAERAVGSSAWRTSAPRTLGARMSERARIFVVTGDEVVRLTLTGTRARDVETVLTVAGAAVRCRRSARPDRVYVGTFDDGLYATDDGGETWRAAWEGVADRRVLAVSVSPSHRVEGVSVVYAGTEPSNLYRSEDGGMIWQLLPELRRLPSEPRWSFPPRPWTHHVRTIALHPTDPDALVVGIELGGVMRSADGGRTWIDHNPQAHSDAHQLLTHALAPERVYEVAGQGIALSPDRGESWRRMDAGLDRHYAWATAVDPADPDLWYASVSRSPFAAHDGGDGQSRLLRSRGNGWSAIDLLGGRRGAAPDALRAGDAGGPARSAVGRAARRRDAGGRGRGRDVVATRADAAGRDRARGLAHLSASGPSCWVGRACARCARPWLTSSVAGPRACDIAREFGYPPCMNRDELRQHIGSAAPRRRHGVGAARRADPGRMLAGRTGGSHRARRARVAAPVASRADPRRAADVLVLNWALCALQLTTSTCATE